LEAPAERDGPGFGVARRSTRAHLALRAAPKLLAAKAGHLAFPTFYTNDGCLDAIDGKIQ